MIERDADQPVKPSIALEDKHTCADNDNMDSDSADSTPVLEPSFGTITEGESNRSLLETLKLVFTD